MSVAETQTIFVISKVHRKSAAEVLANALVGHTLVTEQKLSPKIAPHNDGEQYHFGVEVML